MVLEQIYSVELLKERPKYAFLLGIAYTVFATLFALMLFADDPALVIVGVVSMLLMPSLYQISSYYETKVKEHAIGVWNVIRNNKQFIKVYLYIFFGSFIVFALFSLILPSLATNHLFKQQVSVMAGGATTTGGGYFSIALFKELFTHNMFVMAICFLLSLVAGNGAIFMIIWNASVWGTVFGVLGKNTAIYLQAHPGVIFLLIMLSVFPHVLLEISSYIIAVVAGTMISDAMAKEKILSKSFRRVLASNLLLLLCAVGVLAIAMIVETYVLNNFTTYKTIIQLSSRAIL
ncbi:stage II sporulation protein M [Candidatus Woesearchaeota archaeon]|nr:stage II sporulation protein M [Candidatus Woesearchaeota archaeon]